MADDLPARLLSDAFATFPWSNGPGDRYVEHRHGHDKVLVCASGSIIFTLPELALTLALDEGDRLELPAGTLHGAVVGPRGVTCLESHLPAGSLGPEPRLTAAPAVSSVPDVPGSRAG